jgi:hypothetical protein
VQAERAGTPSLLWRFPRLSYSESMLPILRILPVGGVFLAIMLLVLALRAPEGPPSRLMLSMAPMRGALIDRGEHPEWPQFLMLAAIRRADELNRLRDLPDTPARTDAVPEAARTAALPNGRSDPDPDADDDSTGSIMQPPSATIPVEIGEPSAFELPVSAPEEKPPITSPRRVKSRTESRLTGTHHARRATTPPKTPPAVGFFETLFGGQKTTPTPTPGSSANTANR